MNKRYATTYSNGHTAETSSAHEAHNFVNYDDAQTFRLAGVPVSADPLAFADALRIARGCTDYGGGYRGDQALFEAYQHGIMTVVAALKAADERGISEPQVRMLHCMGRPNTEVSGARSLRRKR